MTTFVDAIDVVYDSTIPYDLRFFQSLDRVVQMEPWLPRDKLMIDMLKSIGIEKGKPFNPDATTQDILKSAAREAHALLEVRYEGMFKPYFDTARWALPAMPDYLKASSDGFSDPIAYPFDSRGLAFTFAFFTPKHLGQGQSYLMTLKDKEGQNFDGSKSYRLTVPANAPVSQYWSATVYDRATHGLIRDMPRSGRGSQSPGLQKNADGSVDHLFRTEGSGGQGRELGADEPERTVRSAVPLVRSGKAVCRQDLEAAGRRADRRSMTGGGAMNPNRRETISLLSSAPAALGMFSVAGTATPAFAQEVKSGTARHDDRPGRIANDRDAYRHARVHSRLRQRLSDRRNDRQALRRA